jgi:sulfane dehydrogenase subunit SoxC
MDQLSPPKLTRRALLRQTVVGAGVVLAAPAYSRVAQAQPLPIPPWSREPGGALVEYGSPSHWESAISRSVSQPYQDSAPGIASAYTPLQRLEGTITPNGLHFARNHAGVPDVDPDHHALVVHGMVRQPLKFDAQTLLNYPLVTRTCFIECSGNSYQHSLSQPRQLELGQVHGLFSAAQWTGVPLSILLEEACIDPDASWLLVEGADAGALSRSLPVWKAVKDCFVALYQNGERLRAEQGYPMRLMVPGWQGNLHIKWLRRIKATDAPTHTRDETSRYSLLMPNGKAEEFAFAIPVKSLITRPSYGQNLAQPGPCWISGLAWSGEGGIAKVEVSVDGGRSWVPAKLEEGADPYAPVRFRSDWHWDGNPAILMSRATDHEGNVQPSHKAWKDRFHPTNRFHCNAIQSWSIDRDGIVENIFI